MGVVFIRDEVSARHVQGLPLYAPQVVLEDLVEPEPLPFREHLYNVRSHKPDNPLSVTTNRQDKGPALNRVGRFVEVFRDHVEGVSA